MVYVTRIFLTTITVSLLCSGPAHAQLNENCTVSILNRTARVRVDGSWKIPNVPASFGRVRARATCTENGVTRSGQSSYVILARDRTAAFDSEISLTTPEPIPASLTLTTPLATLPTGGATTQLTVTARFPDGSTRDVTAGTSGTNYTISNRAVATVSADGVVTAVAPGVVILSALHEGTLGLLRMQVASTSGDTDGDGIPDDVEVANGLNPNDPADATQDPDSDGLTNKQELVDYNTNPQVADTDMLTATVLEEVARATRSYLLPLAYPEGCPTHPAYPAGHAAIAGACATVLKAFFKETHEIPTPVRVSADGLALVPYRGGALTVGGELNKLASNIALGRNLAGVHWRSDGIEGLKLGEAVAMQVLTQLRTTYPEHFPGFRLTRFDGTAATV